MPKMCQISSWTFRRNDTKPLNLAIIHSHFDHFGTPELEVLTTQGSNWSLATPSQMSPQTYTTNQTRTPYTGYHQGPHRHATTPYPGYHPPHHATLAIAGAATTRPKSMLADPGWHCSLVELHFPLSGFSFSWISHFPRFPIFRDFPFPRCETSGVL